MHYWLHNLFLSHGRYVGGDDAEVDNFTSTQEFLNFYAKDHTFGYTCAMYLHTNFNYV